MSESLKDRMQRLEKAILLKKLLTKTELDGIDNVTVQEILDNLEQKDSKCSAS